MYKVPKGLEHYQKMFQKEVTVNDLIVSLKKTPIWEIFLIQKLF